MKNLLIDSISKSLRNKKKIIIILVEKKLKKIIFYLTRIKKFGECAEMHFPPFKKKLLLF